MPQHLVSGDTAGGSLGGTYPNPSVDFDTRLVHWVFDGRGVYDPNMSGTGKVWDGGPAYNNDFNTMFVINALTVASGFWMLNVGSAATRPTTETDLNSKSLTSFSTDFTEIRPIVLGYPVNHPLIAKKNGVNPEDWTGLAQTYSTTYPYFDLYYDYESTADPLTDGSSLAYPNGDPGSFTSGTLIYVDNPTTASLGGFWRVNSGSAWTRPNGLTVVHGAATLSHLYNLAMWRELSTGTLVLEKTNGIHYTLTMGSSNLVADKDITVTEFVTGGGGSVSDTVYGAGWNGDTTVAPSKNAVYDKVESVISTIPVIDDTAYDATSWNGDLDAPSKNAVRDKIESVTSSIPTVSDTAYGSSWNTNTDAPSKNTVYDYTQQITSFFIFNSGGSQGGVRFNTWSDLIAALATSASPIKEIIIEASFTLPTGAWDLKGATLRGLQPDSSFFDPIVVTAPEGATLTNPGYTILQHGIVLYSTATTHSTITITAAGRYNLDQDAIVTAESYPTIRINNTDPIFLILLRGSGFVHPATMSLSAETAQEALDHSGAGDLYLVGPSGVTVMDDDTIIGTVNIIVQSPSAFMDITQTGLPKGTSHVNGTVSYVSRQSWAVNVAYNNSTSGLASTLTQDAIDELSATNRSDFVYDTGATPAGNIYADWSTLMGVVSSIDGYKNIYIKGNQTAEAGTWDMTDVNLIGVGYFPNLTFPNGSELTNWNYVLENLFIVSQNNSQALVNITTAGISRFRLHHAGFKATGSYQLIEIDHPDAYVFIVVGEDSNVLFDTSAIFLCTDMSQLIFLALGGNSRVDNDTVDGTVGTLVMGVGVGSFYGGVSPTFAGYSGTLVPILGEKAALISYDNATSGLTATTVQTAIDEIADDSDVYTPTNVSADRSYDANSTTLDEIADVLGTLIADLQDRGIIG